MKRLKKRWDTEFPTVAETAQNVIDNAKRFRKEGRGRPSMKNNEIAVDHCFLLLLQPLKKLPKVKLTKEIEGSAHKIFRGYLTDVNTIPETRDKVKQWKKLSHLN